jgi:hypothetical protein
MLGAVDSVHCERSGMRTSQRPGPSCRESNLHGARRPVLALSLDFVPTRRMTVLLRPLHSCARQKLGRPNAKESRSGLWTRFFSVERPRPPMLANKYAGISCHSVSRMSYSLFLSRLGGRFNYAGAGGARDAQRLRTTCQKLNERKTRYRIKVLRIMPCISCGTLSTYKVKREAPADGADVA